MSFENCDNLESQQDKHRNFYISRALGGCRCAPRRGAFPSQARKCTGIAARHDNAKVAWSKTACDAVKLRGFRFQQPRAQTTQRYRRTIHSPPDLGHHRDGATKQHKTGNDNDDQESIASHKTFTLSHHQLRSSDFHSLLVAEHQ